jgi:hypothetical protein
VNPSPKSFNEALDELRSMWEQSSPDERGKVLVTLYQEYSKLFISSNNRIWTTAATMIPLSLGSFALLASIPRPTLGQIIAFSLGSWLLMTFWLVVAENHRAHQNGSEAWLRAIEKRWGFEGIPDRKSDRGFLARRGMVRRLRFSLWWTVTVATVAAVLFWPGGVFIR